MEDVCCESKSGVYYTKQSTHKFKVLVRVIKIIIMHLLPSTKLGEF